MKKNLLLLPALLFFLNVHAQERYLPAIPDIPGYETLICDFHMHTVFSDGSVWPTVRVDEAWREGVDAIAITDHLEYMPHKKDIRTDHNRSWQIAKEYAKNKDVIVISGTEITKSMPPGHFNALFIKDATPILNENYELAIEEAANQGAFIMWNHPGWKSQQPDTMLWWDEHTALYEKGWIHGIEVVNYSEDYPVAVDWATERKLTMLSSSDMHDPFLYKGFNAKDHRPSTLVFVTERSEGGIRDALFNQRTVAYFGKKLLGKEAYLKALLQQSLSFTSGGEESKKIEIQNSSDLYFNMTFSNELFQDWSSSFEIKPGFNAILKLPADSEIDQVLITVNNLITGSESRLEISLKELVPVNK